MASSWLNKILLKYDLSTFAEFANLINSAASNSTDKSVESRIAETQFPKHS